GRTIWQQIKGEWPPLIPPPLPLSLERVWQHILLEDPAPPSAEDLAAEAAEEDRCHPESQGARFRRSNPDWLEEKMAFYAAYHGYRRWQEIEHYLNTSGDLSPERSEWMQRHADAIRHLVGEAKAAHIRRYGERPPWSRKIVERRRA